MFFNKILTVVPEIIKPVDIPQMLLEQKETLRKLDLIKEQVSKLKIKNMYEAGNTLKTPIFDTSKLPLMDKAERFFDGIDKVTKYLTHPILIVNAISGASYWICLIIGIGGIMFYVIGHEKGLKYTTGSLLSYTLLQAINWGLNLI